MRKSEVFEAASQGIGITFIIAVGAGTIGTFFGPYGPSLLQVVGSVGTGFYLADKHPDLAVSTMRSGMLVASALATSVAARQIATAVEERLKIIPLSDSTGLATTCYPFQAVEVQRVK